MITNSIARRFDREEAVATLPLVRRIVFDIQDDDATLQELLPELRLARMRSRQLGAVVPELAGLRQRVAEITTRFEGYLSELAQVGCVYRGATGHVDFRGEHEGRPVFFCWEPTEADIDQVHPLGSDCGRRAPIEMSAALPLTGP